MTGFTTNYHVHDDDSIEVSHATYGADRTAVPYVCVVFGDVNLFVHDAATLLALSAEAAQGAAELLKAQREQRDAKAADTPSACLFTATNQSDRKRCGLCRHTCEAPFTTEHAYIAHDVPSSGVRVDDGMTV